MKKNVGQTDKWVRLILGAALVVLFFLIQSGWRWAGLIVGLVLVVTALVNFCPLYAMLGISTNKANKDVK